MRRRRLITVSAVLLGVVSGCHPKAGVRPALPAHMHVFERFGITTEAGLRRALVPVRYNRSYAWLVSWLHDEPTEAKVERALVARDPDDLQSVIGLERALAAMGKVDDAVKVLQVARGRNLQIRDVRGGAFAPWQVDADLCWLLRVQGHLNEAEDACRRATAAGADTADVHSDLAVVLILEGDAPSAVAQAERAVAARDAGAWDHWVLGVALQGSRMPVKARAAFEAALKQDPEMGIAWRPLHGHYTTAALMALNRQDTQWEDAYGLARCGEYYLELGLPGRARRCLDAAEAVQAGSSLGVPVLHLALTSPTAAWAKAQAELKTSRNPALLEAAGWAAFLTGHVGRARSLLEGAVAAHPVEQVANLRLATVCEAQGDEACKKKALAVAIKPDAHDVMSAVVKFLLLLLPLLAAYVVGRSFVVKRIRARAGSP